MEVDVAVPALLPAVEADARDHGDARAVDRVLGAQTPDSKAASAVTILKVEPGG
jgi:hypothetical protein